MSFSHDIKTKLSKINIDCEFCKIAELSGIMQFSAVNKNGRISIITEHEAVAERILNLFSDCIGFEPEAKEYAGGYRFEFEDSSESDITIQRLQLFQNAELFKEELMPFDCCRISFLRGAFLGGGSISDPNKNYHLEFDAKNEMIAKELLKELKSLNARYTTRKKHSIVYMKGYEDIATFMGMIGAGTASMEIYNVSIEKEIRNAVNRRMNCENANIDKVVKAYGKHMTAIEKIKNTIGFEGLPESLCEIAKVRMEYPDESLKELGERLSKPIGKSGVNHRLNRLIEIAESL